MSVLVLGKKLALPIRSGKHQCLEVEAIGIADLMIGKKRLQDLRFGVNLHLLLASFYLAKAI